MREPNNSHRLLTVNETQEKGNLKGNAFGQTVLLINHILLCVMWCGRSWWWLAVWISLVGVVVRCTAEKVGSHLPWCSPQTLSLDSADKNIIKYLQGDGSFVLSYTHCRMRNFEGHHFANVHRAMQGNHLVFMGDSLSRYTYTSLAFFLSNGRWSPSFPGDTPEGYSVSSEFEFKSWPAFYLYTTRHLSRFKEAVSASEIERHPYVSYEVCDCRRGSGTYAVDSITENRHLRLVPVLPLNKLSRLESDQVDPHRNKTLYLLEGDLDSTHDIRVSYVSWFGKHPLQFRKKVSAVPRNRQDFEQYVTRVNELLCSTNATETFFPLTEYCAGYRIPRVEEPAERTDIHVPIYDPAQPMCPASAEEALHLQPPCHVLADILPALNATHLMMNSGMWVNLGKFGDHFLDRFVHAARLFLVPPSCTGRSPSSNSSSHTTCIPTWQLRPLIWRHTYASAVSGDGYTDSESHREVQIVSKLREQSDDLDMFEGNGISSWFAHMFHVRHTNGQSTQYGWTDVVLSVDYLRAKNLLGFVRSHPDAALYGAHQWADEVTNEKDRFNDRYRGIPAQSALGQIIIDEKMTFATDVKPIYEDNLHFVPYVYNEINKIFLSATIPLLSVSRRRRR